MAIVVETLVRTATKIEAEHFDAVVESGIMRSGGPPSGLMVHFTRPEGDGFLMVNVWRSKEDMEPFFDDIVRPALGQAGLAGDPSVVAPVWVFARP